LARSVACEADQTKEAESVVSVLLTRAALE
jgi:hypothetical protein